MDPDLLTKFVENHAPSFFSHELSKTLITPPPPSAFSTFLTTIDTLLSFLNINKIPLNPTLALTLHPHLQEDFKHTSLFQKRIQFILLFELARFDADSSQILQLARLGRSLCMQMALEVDSTSFNEFYLSLILPRYARNIPSGLLLQISQEFELFEETKEYLEGIYCESLPKKRKNYRVVEEVSSPVRRSPRLSSTYVESITGVKENHRRPSRSFNGAVVKKQVSIKGVSRVESLSPVKRRSEISIEAKLLKEINQEHFYDKKESKEQEDRVSNVRVLVASTPIKKEREREYDVQRYKNIFNF